MDSVGNVPSLRPRSAVLRREKQILNYIFPRCRLAS